LNTKGADIRRETAKHSVLGESRRLAGKNIFRSYIQALEKNVSTTAIFTAAETGFSKKESWAKLKRLLPIPNKAFAI
jgi:hypothetical protein